MAANTARRAGRTLSAMGKRSKAPGFPDHRANPRLPRRHARRYRVVPRLGRLSTPQIEEPSMPIKPFLSRTRIAYFTMEIAIRPEINSYSGGLGILAGDTARSCADLDLPIVFVSLLSRAGYFRQEIDTEGRQVEAPDWWEVGRWCSA